MLSLIASSAVWVLIYANDGKITSPAEIREHEMGHVLCPNWKHPRGMDPATGKAYRPPVQCRVGNAKLRVELIEVPVSTSEARARCGGAFGRLDPMLIGCAFPIEDQ